MRRLHRTRRRNGFAFIAALMVILVVAILLMAILTMAVTSRLRSGSRQEYAQALYLAEGGINAMISQWRFQGASNPPANPYVGELVNGGAPGTYQVSFGTVPDPPFGRFDWIRIVSVGTVNTNVPGTAYHVNRTVETWLDRDGDWAWNHVYYSDSDLPEMGPPEYGDINGNGDLEIGGELGGPEDFIDHPNGPGGGSILPTPMWDKWHEWVRFDKGCDPVTKDLIPRDTNGDGIADPRWPDQATLPPSNAISVDATPDDPVTGETDDRHIYWYRGELDYATHAADAHASNDENSFMPDWFGENNPWAYICNSRNKRFTVTFTDGDYTGSYLVHGDIHVKNRAHVKGTLIATGNIYFYGVADASIEPEVMNPDDPCDERVYYPALIAGQNVLVRDQGAGDDEDRDRLRVSGIVWAGASYTGQASNVEGCVVSPDVTLGGNFLTRYGILIDGCNYVPGESPPPWFREPDRNALQPLPKRWREL